MTSPSKLESGSRPNNASFPFQNERSEVMTHQTDAGAWNRDNRNFRQTDRGHSDDSVNQWSRPPPDNNSQWKDQVGNQQRGRDNNQPDIHGDFSRSSGEVSHENARSGQAWRRDEDSFKIQNISSRSNQQNSYSDRGRLDRDPRVPINDDIGPKNSLPRRTASDQVPGNATNQSQERFNWNRSHGSSLVTNQEQSFPKGQPDNPFPHPKARFPGTTAPMRQVFDHAPERYPDSHVVPRLDGPSQFRLKEHTFAEYENHDSPRFDSRQGHGAAPRPRFDGPRGPRFNDPRFEGPRGPRFNDPRLEGPRGPRLNDPRFDGPQRAKLNDSKFDGSRAPRFSDPGFDGRIRPNFDRSPLSVGGERLQHAGPRPSFHESCSNFPPEREEPTKSLPGQRPNWPGGPRPSTSAMNGRGQMFPGPRPNFGSPQQDGRGRGSQLDGSRASFPDARLKEPQRFDPMNRQEGTYSNERLNLPSDIGENRQTGDRYQDQYDRDNRGFGREQHLRGPTNNVEKRLTEHRNDLPSAFNPRGDFDSRNPQRPDRMPAFDQLRRRDEPMDSDMRSSLRHSAKPSISAGLLPTPTAQHDDLDARTPMSGPSQFRPSNSQEHGAFVDLPPPNYPDTFTGPRDTGAFSARNAVQSLANLNGASLPPPNTSTTSNLPRESNSGASLPPPLMRLPIDGDVPNPIIPVTDPCIKLHSLPPQANFKQLRGLFITQDVSPINIKVCCPRLYLP